MTSQDHVQRIGKEVESVGERFSFTRKRVSWHFVFVGSMRVRTIVLAHSRFSGGKQIWLDGRRVFESETYSSGNWMHQLNPVDAQHKGTTVTIMIRAARGFFPNEEAINSSYQLCVSGKMWEELPEREMLKQSLAPCVWAKDRYVRRMFFESRNMKACEGGEGQVTAWTFTYGQLNSIHRLEIFDNETLGELLVCLDMRVLKRTKYEEIISEVWEFEYIQPPNYHSLWIRAIIMDETKVYEFLIDGCPWNTITETDYMLAPHWLPVYSRSQDATYFANELSKESRWKAPLVSRDGVLSTAHSMMNAEKESVPINEQPKRYRYLSVDGSEPTLCVSSRTYSSCDSEDNSPTSSNEIAFRPRPQNGSIRDLLSNTVLSSDLLAKFSIFDRRNRSENNTIL
uniref:Uncharacterized protein AlNc14C26G2536 n=1 Tax=Albugo laibachii Nc14 TaxID=890382 RepID=F0W6Q0_9STRA|nr:conserved hypothetical protein [Albugo laibachii Nc14]|eukprot:CCA16795.1 conserved hypothetical protein [Albugo laibachii Nc14]